MCLFFVYFMCIHHLWLYSLYVMDTHIHSLETYVMNVCYEWVCALRVSLFITCVFSRDTCYECVYSFRVSYSFHVMDTHIHSLGTYVMNVCIHMLWMCVFICYACVYSFHVSYSLHVSLEYECVCTFHVYPENNRMNVCTGWWRPDAKSFSTTKPYS